MKAALIVTTIVIVILLIVWRTRSVSKAKKKRMEHWDNIIKQAQENRRKEEEERKAHYHEYVSAITPYFGKKGTMASDISVNTSEGGFRTRLIRDIVVDRIEEGEVYYTEYDKEKTYSSSMEVWRFYMKMQNGDITYHEKGQE